MFIGGLLIMAKLDFRGGANMKDDETMRYVAMEIEDSLDEGERREMVIEGLISSYRDNDILFNDDLKIVMEEND